MLRDRTRHCNWSNVATKKRYNQIIHVDGFRLICIFLLRFLQCCDEVHVYFVTKFFVGVVLVLFILFSHLYVVEILFIHCQYVLIIMIAHAIKRKISQIMVFIIVCVVRAAKEQHVDSSKSRHPIYQKRKKNAFLFVFSSFSLSQRRCCCSEIHFCPK